MKSSVNLFAKSTVCLTACSAKNAAAHVSEQGIVLLLPTGVYTVAGCLAVISSIVVVSLILPKSTQRLFRPVEPKLQSLAALFHNKSLPIISSLLSLSLLLSVVLLGFIGTRDPLANLLPLTIWTLWWIAVVTVHIVTGNVWHWINPWTGLYALLTRNREINRRTHSALDNIGCWPAVIIYLLFYTFIIADLAPDDPARLANVVLAYIIFTFTGMFLLGGDKWLKHVECFTILCRFLSQLSPLKLNHDTRGWSVGFPGWKAMQSHDLSFSQSVFLLTVLACGSFDGVNDTFWWLDLIGINPLAFPGRSAVVWWSSGGMLLANVLLFVLFSFVVWLGLLLANRYQSQQVASVGFKRVFCQFSISILPIAAAYHASHYLISFLINGQYLVAALSDPLANGSNYLKLNNYQVTTGFLNTVESVRGIWITQASLVVIGHILAVLMAHHMTATIYQNRVQSLLLHLPLACFMAAYTWFGLWLLAAPRGA